MQFRPMTAFLAWSQACHCSQLVCFHTFQPTHEQGYVLVVLGSIKQADGSWTPVKEYGHRLVYWALLGPFQHDPQAWTGAAPEQQAGPVVMHTCHNRSCLQPLHLLLGNYSENNTRRALEEDEIGYGDAHRRRDTRAVELRAEQAQAEGP